MTLTSLLMFSPEFNLETENSATLLFYKINIKFNYLQAG